MSFISFLIILMIALGFFYEALISESKAFFRIFSNYESKQIQDHESFSQLNQTYFYYLDGKIKKPRNKSYYNPRLNLDFYERSKCNIASCLKDEKGKDLLKRLLLNLFPQIFKEEHEAIKLIKAWHLSVEKEKNHPSTLSIYRLKPEDPIDVLVYEKLIYHPLFEKLFYFDALSNKKPLCFRFAKMPLFEIALGKELSDLILDKEKQHFDETKKKLTIEEIKAFLKDQGHEDKIPFITRLFAFKEPKKRMIHVESIDKNRNIKTTLFKKFQESFE